MTGLPSGSHANMRSSVELVAAGTFIMPPAPHGRVRGKGAPNQRGKSDQHARDAGWWATGAG